MALRSIDRITGEMAPLDAQINWIARRQPGCKALHRGIYGVGPLTAVCIWAEFGDVGRFGSSRRAVRHTGLDITVHSSDSKRAPGHLSRQGPQVLRWALYEAAMCAARPASPDHGYYLGVKAEQGSGRALLSQARRIARRAYHLLVDLGEQGPGAGAGTAPSPDPGRIAMRSSVRALPIKKMTRGLLPIRPCRRRLALVGLERPSGRTSSRGVTPSTIMSPDPRWSVGRDKAGRQRAHHRVGTFQEVVPVA